MLKRTIGQNKNYYTHCSFFCKRYFSSSFKLSKKSKDEGKENELYFGRFTKAEYDEAKKSIINQIELLEKEIKGDINVRENISKMPSFPAASNAKQIKLENLTDILSETIKTTGPISLSAFMRQCLTHPNFGYYTTRDPLDSNSGDFITSPEISSMFGEMIGVWLYSTFFKQGKPDKVRIIEFGPGKGTLMFDCLSSFNKLNKSKVSIEIILIEASTILRKEQWKLLCGEENLFTTDDQGFNVSTTKWGQKIKWMDTEKDIAIKNGITNYVIAHEFFDALPIKSFQKTEDGWRELLVEHSPSVKNTQMTLPSADSASDNDQNFLQTEFHLTMSPKETPSSMLPTLSPRYKDMPVGSRIEICADAELYILKMVQLLCNQEKLGSVLIIDYGSSEGIPDNTLRGIFKHKFVSPFAKPGDVDLSVDVDFENLKLLASRFCDAFGPREQGDWLHELGIGYRADQLIKAKSGNFDAQEKIYNAYKRLTSKEKDSMGRSYKFLCLLPKDSELPLGFGGVV
ncbi:uncharacterized protein PRCAT00002181001 [Priceomyces carsonii]|uniref:uncharacterized protein n=1 Tax=Priceomyces carsonii TaxID=28549 RepID=UPI002EDAB4DC|nr:unnamed protein product [Priceomyces carsonii]